MMVIKINQLAPIILDQSACILSLGYFRITFYVLSFISCLFIAIYQAFIGTILL